MVRSWPENDSSNCFLSKGHVPRRVHSSNICSFIVHCKEPLGTEFVGAACNSSLIYTKAAS